MSKATWFWHLELSTVSNKISVLLSCTRLSTRSGRTGEGENKIGYTHYWRRKREVPFETFQAIRQDFERIVLALDNIGVRLGDGLGKGVPVLTQDEVCFNGLEQCGHAKNADIVIPWPTPDAGGVGHNLTAQAGDWYAGATLSHRACDGDCSYETFDFPRKFMPEIWEKPEAGLYFQFCKTAFRPYDVAVTAFLLIAKHHWYDGIRVSSDGDQPQWDDARLLCQEHLGYGADYVLGETGDGRELVSRNKSVLDVAS